MAHPTYKEVTGGATRSRKASGVGSDGDPHVLHNNIDLITEGASVDIGDKDDAAIITDAVGSLSGKLRGLVKWASERMPASLGQKAMAASLPVVFASDQSSIPTTNSGGVKDNGPQYTPNAPFIMSNADVSATAQNITPAPTSGEKIIVDDLVISVSTTAEVFIIEETTLTEVFRAFILANQPFVWSPQNRLRGLTIDKRLTIKTVAAAPIRTTALTHSEA